MTPVTKVFLPSLDEYQDQLKRIWKNEWLTNRGELVLELEAKLKDFIGLNNILLTTNGTLPLQIALQVLGKHGEIITTPFSYVATTSSIVWENCTPVFVDINEDYLTIDENKIEAAITSNTSAILATHVFGNPCNVKVIDKIAKKYNLKVIYDAAHCFGVTYEGSSIFNFGNVSTCSFHATKIFHTGEGGALICNDEELKKILFYSHNFGHIGPDEFYGVGINAKMSELQAAMGLTVLPHMNVIFRARKEVVDYYDKKLNFTHLRRLKIREGTKWNYSYYPIIFQNESELVKVQKVLNKHNIYPRRYFYPSLNKLNYVKQQNMPISEDISSKILCLPLSVGIEDSILKKIVDLINLNIN